MSTRTPAELIGYMVAITGAEPANSVLAEPGSGGHVEPYEPWSAPVMVLAGFGHDGGPWLYLACRCGWWLGYSAQYDPAELAKVAAVHAGGCKLTATTTARVFTWDYREQPPLGEILSAVRKMPAPWSWFCPETGSQEYALILSDHELNADEAERILLESVEGS
jgi:hypothetical protein